MSKLTISHQFHYASDCKENSVHNETRKKTVELMKIWRWIVLYTFANNLLTTEGPISSSSPCYDKIYNITITANMLPNPCFYYMIMSQNFTWINLSYRSNNLSSKCSPILYVPLVSSGEVNTCKSLVILHQVTMKHNISIPDEQKFDY